jgi:hypothetical protein
MAWVRDRCTCPSPTWDDPFVGACEFCERQEWEATWGQRDEDLEAMLDGSAALTRDEALAAMGEAEDSLMLGGSGGGERDPDMEWY